MRVSRRTRVSPVVITLTVCIGMSGIVTSAASAAAGGWWWDAYQMDAIRAQDLTGSGVNIALIDDQINPSVEVLRGTELSVSEPAICGGSASTDVATEKSTHGTTMAAMIVGNGSGVSAIRGIAPGASVRFYGYGPDACDSDAESGSPFARAVERAMSDGAKIIVTSVAMSASPSSTEAIAYALARGVVVVASTNNPETFAVSASDISAQNGIIAASAVDQTGALQRTKQGSPFVDPLTTVVAAGAGLPTVGVPGSWEESEDATGSSFAAPLVAGMLAIEMQRYPSTSGNQVIQALIHTTDGLVRDPVRASNGYGYGAAWLSSMITVDPTHYPDENPLLEKNPSHGPTVDQITAASQRDTVLPSESNGSGHPGSAGSDSSDVGSLWGTPMLWGVLGAVGLVVGAGVITLLVLLSRRRTKSS